MIHASGGKLDYFTVLNINYQMIPTRSLTYRSEDRDVSVLYTQGRWEGRLGSDMLRFIEGPNATARVEVASILSSHQFFINGSMWEGILGLAYGRLSKVL